MDANPEICEQKEERMSTAMELRYMEWIVKRVQRLSPHSRRWLMQRLSQVECKDVA